MGCRKHERVGEVKKNKKMKTLDLDDLGEVKLAEGLEILQVASDVNLEPASQPYIVMLINSTDHVVRLVRVNGGAWTATPLIGKTCNSTDYHNCASNGKYKPLVSVNCGTNVKIDVGWQEGDGSWRYTGWDTFYAKCEYAGGIIQLVNA